MAQPKTQSLNILRSLHFLIVVALLNAPSKCSQWIPQETAMSQQQSTHVQYLVRIEIIKGAYYGKNQYTWISQIELRTCLLIIDKNNCLWLIASSFLFFGYFYFLVLFFGCMNSGVQYFIDVALNSNEPQTYASNGVIQ